MTTQAQPLAVNRNYKSRLFIMIFSDKERLLKLYNAIARKHYRDPESLTITTLENAIYMSMKNDVSFLIDSRLSLYEHQSTYNPNMALRFLFYLADIYSALVNDENLYSRKKVLIPPPRFVVFYNGIEERPDYEELRLSDLYLIPEEKISLELLVDMLNINKGHNQELLDACKDLRDYAEYIYRVRKYAEDMPIGEAVDRAINECIQEGILKEFLEKHRAEARAVSIYEYNEEKHMRMEREESYADGFEQGRTEGHAQGRAEERTHLFELITQMTADGMADQIPRLAEEPGFYDTMVGRYFAEETLAPEHSEAPVPQHNN